MRAKTKETLPHPVAALKRAPVWRENEPIFIFLRLRTGLARLHRCD